MLKFSKIFLLVLVFVLGGCCALFLTAERTSPIELVEAEESIEYSAEEDIGIDCLMAQELDPDSSEENYYTSYSSYYTASSLVVDVVWVNFTDCAMFDSTTYEFYSMQLDAVSQYFSKVSRGNLDIYFNISVCDLDESVSLYKGQSMNYYTDIGLYNTSYNSGVPISENHGASQVKFLLLSADFTIDSTKMFWPHAYPSNKLMVMHNYTAGQIICHELYHTLGLLDLYIGNDNIKKAQDQNIDFFKPVESEDLMATCQSTNTPTSAYNRYLLGWLGGESDYSDSTETAIEKISTNNTYVINEGMQTSGTIAYKFGINSNEFFLIECRNVFGKNYIILQRINKTLSSNINAQNHSQCYIFSFRNQSNLVYFGEGDYIGNDSNGLYYANSSEASFAMGNIVDLGNHQMQFDFFTVESTAVEKTFNLVSASNPSLAINNAVISINDVVVNENASSSVNLSVKEADVVKVEHVNYETLTYVIDPEFVNFSSGAINLKLCPNDIVINDPQDPNTFQIETIINGIQNFVTNNNVFIYINNILQNFTNTIKLNEGDKLKIVSESSETFCSSYIDGALTNSGSGNITVTNKTIRIELNVATCNYYLNVRNSNGEFVNITSLYLYNNFTNEWDLFNNVSTVYVKGVKVYALKDVAFYYTQVKVNHASYNTTSSQMAYINVGNNFYNIQLNKNIIQTTGDFISGIANNIKNWFA